jgi:hypothetical protein
MPDFQFISKSFIPQIKKWAKNGAEIHNGLMNYEPYLKYWENFFGDKSKLRIIFSGLEPYIEFIELSHIFDNKRLLKDTNISNPVPANEYIKTNIDYLKKINIMEGAYEP